MTVLEMVIDGYDAKVVEKKEKRQKRQKINKYAANSRFDSEMSGSDSNGDEDTEPLTEFPKELLEPTEDILETPKRIPTEQLRALYSIFLNSNKAGNPVYQAVIVEVRACLQSKSIKLKSFDVQQIIVFARIKENVMEYYCQIPTKNFDLVGQIVLAEGDLSQRAEL